MFGRPYPYHPICCFSGQIPELSVIFNLVIEYLYDRYGHLLQDLNQTWSSAENLRLLADAVHAKGAPLQNCWGVIDGTARPICRPIRNQKVVFSGHKRTHVIKFQSIMAPNGLIAHLLSCLDHLKEADTMPLCWLKAIYNIPWTLRWTVSIFMGILHIQ